MSASTLLFGAFVLAAAICAGAIVLIRPLLMRHAMAKPTARSSHRVPTPQGGGAAVVVATVVVVAATLATPMLAGGAGSWGWVAAATLLLAAVGYADDVAALPVAPRLLAQFAAVALVVFALPNEARILPPVPWAVERAGLLVAGVYLVNLVNFMDGIDWMTVVEFVPVTGGVAVLSAFGALEPIETVAAVALCGAVIGFAPFNRPVASLFLGDVGSLPLGLLMFWLLTAIASRGHIAAALLLPLYYLADATITLARRALRGEAILRAHRTHFYQRATDLGFSVPQIVARVFAVNLGLAALAAWTVARPALATDAMAMAAGLALVAALLVHLSTPRR